MVEKSLSETKDDGLVTVERVNGKSAGEVFIMLEDGRSGDDALLSEIIQGMDRTMYENIFSFNLHGLQEVHRLKDEEITRYLIAIGTLGTDKLFHTEQVLQKELDQLFKPNGRKPLLNEQLNILREADKALKIAKHQNAEYESILIKKDQTIRNISAMEDKSEKNQQELQYINELVNNWSLIQEKIQIKQELELLGTIQFPTDGLARFESYSEKVISLSSRFQAIENRINETKEQLKENEPHPSFNLVEAEKLISEWPSF